MKLSPNIYRVAIVYFEQTEKLIISPIKYDRLIPTRSVICNQQLLGPNMFPLLCSALFTKYIMIVHISERKEFERKEFTQREFD